MYVIICKHIQNYRIENANTKEADIGYLTSVVLPQIIVLYEFISIVLVNNLSTSSLLKYRASRLFFPVTLFIFSLTN